MRIALITNIAVLCTAATSAAGYRKLNRMALSAPFGLRGATNALPVVAQTVLIKKEGAHDPPAPNAATPDQSYKCIGWLVARCV